MSTNPAAFAHATVYVFDAYGTLFDLGAMVARAEKVLGDRARPLMELWRAKQLEYSWLRSLMGRHTDFWHLTGEALDYALSAFGIHNPLLRADLMEGWLSPRAYPDAADTLRHLHQAGHKTAILSNGTRVMVTSALTSSGLHGMVDAVLSVDEVSVFKPHPSVYRLVTDHFAVAPEQVAFVSANGWDVAGASVFGFNVAWINRLGRPTEVLPGVPVVTLKQLGELPTLA